MRFYAVLLMMQLNAPRNIELHRRKGNNEIRNQIVVKTTAACALLFAAAAVSAQQIVPAQPEPKMPPMQKSVTPFLCGERECDVI